MRVIPLLTVSYETGTSPPNVHVLAQPPAVYGIYVISEYLNISKRHDLPLLRALCFRYLKVIYVNKKLTNWGEHG